jgi:superfamily II DNA/RNA helicase
VHRIGRTARAKNTGTAYSFFTSSNAKQAKDLVEILREAKQEINPKLFDLMQMAKGMGNGRGMWAVQ